MTFKKIMHFIEEKNLDRKTPYTEKELSEQGFMAPAFRSSDEIEKKNPVILRNALVELKEHEANTTVEETPAVVVVANSTKKEEVKEPAKKAVKEVQNKKKAAKKTSSKKKPEKIKEKTAEPIMDAT